MLSFLFSPHVKHLRRTSQLIQGTGSNHKHTFFFFALFLWTELQPTSAFSLFFSLSKKQSEQFHGPPQHPFQEPGVKLSVNQSATSELKLTREKPRLADGGG